MSAPPDVLIGERRGSVLVLIVHNPPVNAASAALRMRLLQELERADRDNGVAALVLSGAGKNFVTGADLSELAGEIGCPSYRDTLDAIEGCRKPVVAAMHGNALGAGLEIALACHYRLAHPGLRIGFPEIGLGIVPGAGGTQRLPRLIGAGAALELLLSGAPVAADRALALGLVDVVRDGDPADRGTEFAHSLVEARRGPRRTLERAAAGLDTLPQVAEDLLRRHARALRGRTTQLGMIEAVAAARLPQNQGLEVESRISAASLATVESRALRHIFFAERATARPRGVAPLADISPFRNVAVIGAGTMGSGIAMAFANAGLRVLVVDSSEEGLGRGRGLIRSAFESAVKKERMSAEAAERVSDAIGMTLALEEAAEADLVVEAVIENIDVKKEVLRRVDELIRPGAILATNTSSLSVTELAAATRKPERVVGLHFFSPAHVMRLLEVVRGTRTSDRVVAASLEIAKRLGKIPVVARDAFGFIGNRMMLDGAFREAEQMMLEGATVEQIDNAVEAFGFAMGPGRVNDMAGIDIGTLVRRQLLQRERRPGPYCVVSDALTQCGRTGQKVGLGFYSYAADPRAGAPDLDVERIIETLACERDIPRRAFTDDEIVERFVLQLVNVGSQILAENIAERAADIDVVWVHGYGFPRFRGGPMFHADTLGLRHVAERVRYWYGRAGPCWRPSPLLEKLANEGGSFAAYDNRSRG